jgi:hypothetical protein
MRVLFLAVLLVIPSTLVIGQKAETRIPVSLKVSADDVVESQFISNINNGLRALSNIVVTNNDDARFQISVFIIPLTVGQNRKTGYAASVVVLEREVLKDTVIRLINGGNQNDDIKELLRHVCVNNSLAHHSILSGEDSIEQLSKRIVADVDAGPIEDFRQLLQRIESKKP